MTVAMFLTRDEIKALTLRIQHVAQVKVLCAMGIEHRIRPDGSVAVLRAHVEQSFGANSPHQSRTTTEPNWGAINATRSQA